MSSKEPKYTKENDPFRTTLTLTRTECSHWREGCGEQRRREGAGAADGAGRRGRRRRAVARRRGAGAAEPSAGLRGGKVGAAGGALWTTQP